MNYFFGLSGSSFKSVITIPKFQNNSKSDYSLYPCEAYIFNNEWIYKKAHFNENKNFFFLNHEVINNDKIFFLSNMKQILENKIKINELLKFNDFTETFPVKFRSNFRINFKNKGFSSYQSEYPFDMSKKKGNILSPIYPLLNLDADINYILFRNIYRFPIKKKFKIHFINIDNKKILNTENVFTNFSNLIFVDKKFIKKNIYVFSEEFLGIPIFISIGNNHISMEHTHPPHHYILSEDRYETISKLKTEIKNNIISQC